MKSFLNFSSVVLLLMLSLSAGAQTAAIKDIPADGDTTISIQKGSKNTGEYAITEGRADVAGDPEILSKAARDSWKKECDKWKQELKDLNKENQILAISCNSPVCKKTDASETQCQSEGVYKLKTKIK